MRKTGAISSARTYGELARALHLKISKASRLQQVAVCDSLGLWHTYPGAQVYPFAKDFDLSIGKRILLKNRGRKRSRAFKESRRNQGNYVTKTARARPG
jgi:hypothetical protein